MNDIKENPKNIFLLKNRMASLYKMLACYENRNKYRKVKKLKHSEKTVINTKMKILSFVEPKCWI